MVNYCWNLCLSSSFMYEHKCALHKYSLTCAVDAISVCIHFACACMHKYVHTHIYMHTCIYIIFENKCDWKCLYMCMNACMHMLHIHIQGTLVPGHWSHLYIELATYTTRWQNHTVGCWHTVWDSKWIQTLTHLVIALNPNASSMAHLENFTRKISWMILHYVKIYKITQEICNNGAPIKTKIINNV